MLSVKNLCKTYPSFKLDNVSFELKEGYIMGFIGNNGAGKSTTLKCMLNLVKPDSGEVTVFGKNMAENELSIKQNIGFMLGAADYYSQTALKVITDVYKRFFTQWNNDTYEKYLKKFNLDESKKIRELSAGMKVKYGLALALSHNSQLLIFDEPTSGLDPIARDELLDIFQEIVEDGKTSILFSTHITSDLDKCADYIIFIRNGQLIANTTKDDLLEQHVLVSGNVESLDENLKKKLVSYKTHSFGFKGLAKKSDLSGDLQGIQTEKPNLEDIMVYYNKETK